MAITPGAKVRGHIKEAEVSNASFLKQTGFQATINHAIVPDLGNTTVRAENSSMKKRYSGAAGGDYMWSANLAPDKAGEATGMGFTDEIALSESVAAKGARINAERGLQKSVMEIFSVNNKFGINPAAVGIWANGLRKQWEYAQLAVPYNTTRELAFDGKLLNVGFGVMQRHNGDFTKALYSIAAMRGGLVIPTNMGLDVNGFSKYNTQRATQDFDNKMLLVDNFISAA